MERKKDVVFLMDFGNEDWRRVRCDEWDVVWDDGRKGEKENWRRKKGGNGNWRKKEKMKWKKERKREVLIYMVDK